MLDTPGPAPRRGRAAPRGRRPSARTRALRVRTRPTGAISVPKVRIGLTCSAAPSSACAAPIRPPRRRYSSVSRAEPDVEAARACERIASHQRRRRRRRPPPRAPRRSPGSRARRRRSHRRRLEMRTPCFSSRHPRRLAAALAGARQSLGDVDRDDVAALPRPAARTRRGSRRPTAARSTGMVGDSAEPRVERVEVVVAVLALEVTVPADVEAETCETPHLSTRWGGRYGVVSVTTATLTSRSRRSRGRRPPAPSTPRPASTRRLHEVRRPVREVVVDRLQELERGGEPDVGDRRVVAADERLALEEELERVERLRERRDRRRGAPAP